MPAYDAGRFDPPAPLAMVGLRHPEKADVLSNVPMLIDTGADVTLVPHSSILPLGATIDSGKAYELMGFDGGRRVARAVRLDLLFLRRAFKGRFLVIDQEWGILGRDVLNHVAVVFDGPRLSWMERLASNGA